MGLSGAGGGWGWGGAALLVLTYDFMDARTFRASSSRERKEQGCRRSFPW